VCVCVCVCLCLCVCVCVLQLSSPEEKCQQLLEPPYDEMVAAHLRCC